MKNVQQNSKRWAGMVGMMCLLAVSVSSCIKNDSNNNQPLQPAALISVINTSPDSGPLDFYLEPNKVNVAPIYFGNGLDYTRANVGKRTFTFTASNTKTVYKSDTLTLVQDKAYSLFLANVSGHQEYIVLKDTIAKPADNSATIRFINLSPDAPAVDFAIKDGAVLSANKAYKSFSGFMPIAASKTYTIEIRKAGTNTVLATLNNIPLAAGSVYTVWLQGLASATDTKKLSGNIQTNAYYF